MGKKSNGILMTIEIGEHARLIDLFYAVYEFDKEPSEKHHVRLKAAFDECERYFRDGKKMGRPPKGSKNNVPV